MQLIPLGDSAVLIVIKARKPVVALDAVGRLTRALNTLPLAGITDIVPSYTTVTVHYDPVRVPSGPGTPAERVMKWLEVAPDLASGANRKVKRKIVIPVCYGGEGGPDIAAVAKRANLTVEKVIRLHSKAVYRVAAIGFYPGFPYLFGLAPALATPRRATPRTEVAPGSVGIGGTQTGIYPLATPGGWSLIGRTPLRLFQPENEADPTLLQAGDIVKFKVINEKQAAQLQEVGGHVLKPKVNKQSAVFEVIKPGTLTTVQDLGRPGRQHLGISPGGAMDVPAARIANMLLGNDENAPLLEVTLSGPELRFLKDTWISVTGASIRDVPGWRPWRVCAGQVVSLAMLTKGARAYVAFAGGLDIPSVLGGAGTLLRSCLGGLGGRALLAGDQLSTGNTALDTSAHWCVSNEFNAANGGDVTVRFMKGPQWDWFAAASRRTFLGKLFKVAVKSDRMGIRLEGADLRLENEKWDLPSEGVSCGTIQVPPDGQPIVLMADRQTIGGYPKIAQIISVDLPKLAQMRAGEGVRFQEVTLEEAQSLYLAQEQSLAMLGNGLRAKLKLANG